MMFYRRHFTLCFLYVSFSLTMLRSLALLFVQQNECRQLDSIDGLWTFVREPPNSIGIGNLNNWSSLDLSTFENSSLIPVPAAFNDLTADKRQRDHVGWVWYQRKYYLSHFMQNWVQRRSFIRFGSVQYYAIVYLNGIKVTEHVGGHLPFQVELPLSKVNVITVAVNNTLSNETIPPGDFQLLKLSTGLELIMQTPNFDFFNYAGILRSVYIWHLPYILIKGIRIRTDSSGSFSYRIDVNDGGNSDVAIQIRIIIYTWDGNELIELFGQQNSTQLEKIELWWPKGMGKPNLYIAKVSLLAWLNGTEVELDVYRESFGFRSVTVDKNKIFVNGRPFYCHGFGMHEDFGVHGRGFDRVSMIKDLEMFDWLNGNCYRTSHYPYDEERAYMADIRGIAVITEVPAVGLRVYNRSLQQLHGRMITEMILRDQNHPSIIMWSLANEPEMVNESAYDYFSELVVLTRHLDSTRPVTVVFGYASKEIKVASLLDVICVNDYFGWYRDFGMLEAIKDQLTEQIRSWRHNFSKPVILSEYGAEAITGFNEQPSITFSEQYQAELIQETGTALDDLRCTDDVAGEMLWNFADFMTAQSITRVIGNHKGVLTRERKPKLGAYVIQKRYKKLLGELEGMGACHVR